MATKQELDAFLAKGGTISKVGANVRTTTEREMHHAIRGETVIVERVADEDDYREMVRAEREREIFADARMGGASVDAAYQEATGWRHRRFTRNNRKRNMEAQARYNDEWGVDY